MSRVQLALNVDDLEASITFYSKLFGTEPIKVEPGYADYAIAEPALKLVLLENPGHGGSINHLGVEVGSSEAVHGEIARLTGEGLFTEEEIDTTCCFATRDKMWVTAPDAERWEVYTVLAGSDTACATSTPGFELTSPDGVPCCGTAAETPAPGGDAPAVCCTRAPR
ncbi:ArsI/CadI family heavy metal resistance metalloenzyme [Tsukamurella soli]|uniref:ArsI/CadI family heavy metal resistance metalloenzyme n=1 Tax=Tsukamurella soli TaxID=644556 RepID=A0ABP8JXR8_9ACTN